MAGKRPDVAVDLDPDYENVAVHQAKRIKLLEKDAKEASVKKIASIIKSQFSNAIAQKRYEIDVADQRLHQAHMMLDRLRAYIVASYYSTEEKFSKEIGRALAYQSSLHPAVKDILLGKRPRLSPTSVPNSQQVTPCNSTTTSRPSSTLNTSGHSSLTYGSPEISTASVLPDLTDCSLRAVSAPASPDIVRASRFKTKKRIIVGNVSRYIPMDKREENDQSTHKWMVYVRGPKEEPLLDHFVKKVWFFLHPSYRPNDLVEVTQPPFHLTRRGWGEFPVRVQLHFHDPRNKRVDVIHKLKLDKTYTGLQTLGAETVVDILVYKEMESVSRLSCALPAGIDQSGEFARTDCTVTAATIATAVRTENRINEHVYSATGKSSVSITDSSDLLAHIKTEPCDSDDQCAMQHEDDLQTDEHVTLNLKHSDTNLLEHNSPKHARTTNTHVTSSPRFKISHLRSLNVNASGSDVTQTDLGAAEALSSLPSLTQPTSISVNHSTPTNVRILSSASSCTQTVLSVGSAKVGGLHGQPQTNTIAVPRQPKLDSVSVLQKSLLSANHVMDQSHTSSQGPLRILQGDAFTKPVLIVPKAAKPTAASDAVKISLSSPSPSLLSSGHAKASMNTVPPTTPLLIIPTLPKSSAKVSTLNNNLSPSIKAQLASPPQQTISSLCSEVQTKVFKPAVGANTLQAGVSLIKSPSSSVSTASASSPANPSATTNNFYIKCVDKHGNIFLVPVASANNVKPRTTNATPTQVCSSTASATTPPALNNRVPSSSSSAQPSSLPTYLLQLVPSKPGTSMQAQLVRLPLPNSTHPSPTPAASMKMLGRTLNTSVASSLHTAAMNKSSSAGTTGATSVSATDVMQQSPGVAINIDEFYSMAAIIKSFVKQFPITSPNPDRIQHPYCAPSPETFLSWYIGKQRASEWQRAKAVRNAILEAFSQSKKWSEKKVWSTKEILWWCRRYGHTPMKPVPTENQETVTNENGSVNTYTEAKSILNLLEERQNELKDDETNKEDEVEVDILTVEEPRKPHTVSADGLNPSPRPLLRLHGPSEAQLIHSEAASIGVKFQPVEIRPGVVASLAEMMILAASKLFIEDIIREGLSKGFQRLGGNRCPNTITVEDVHTGLASLPECDFLTNKYLGKGIVKCITKEDT